MKTNNLKKQVLSIRDKWNIIGDCDYESDPRFLIVHNASVIRYWGTTEGLGQIALKGVTPETILDPCGTVKVNFDNLLFAIDCVV